MNDIELMKILIEKINDANYRYYTLDDPNISDKEYDALLDKLLLLEKKTNTVLENSPTVRVGGEILKGFNKYYHSTPLYSLQKCTDIVELKKWFLEIQKDFPDAYFSCEHKFDGLSIVVEYENGRLIKAGTRGNGKVGEDVTEQIKTIKNIPLTILYKGHLIVRGEVIMTISAFEKYNKTSEEKLKNPRNAAAGALRNLDPKITANRNLSAIIYEIEMIDDEFETQQQFVEFLRENRFYVQNNIVFSNNFDVIQKEIERVDGIKTKLDVMIDGMVLKINTLSFRNKIGYTAKHPKWAMAFKFDALEVTTTLNNIDWQVGRTGKITPIANLEPVELAGATIKRATLNNINDIRRKNISIKSRVFIRRSNEVIPEVMGLAERSTDAIEITQPATCPSCGSDLKEIGANLFCLNHSNCNSQIVERLMHFCSRDAMNIVGLSEKTILTLHSAYNISYPYQLYSLTREQLLTLPLFKDKKADNLISNIQNSKNPDFASFIYALGIIGIGKKAAYDLSKNFANYEELKAADITKLLQIYAIGDVMAQSIVDYFNDSDNIENIEKLFLQDVKIKYANNNNQSDFFKNKKIVLTGSLQNYTRSELTKILQDKGADVVSSVSASTDFVIVGVDAGSKLSKATALKIELIYEDKLDEWLKK